MIPVRVALLMIFALLESEAFAQTECSPAEFMAREPESVVASEYMQIAFIRTATKEQYEMAREKLADRISFGPVSGLVDYDKAREAAKAEAEALKFDFGLEYYSSYLAQKISDNAKSLYVDCLRSQKPEPGLRLWLDRREGDYYFLNGIWIGKDPKSKGNWIKTETIEDDVYIVKIPQEWRSGEEKIVVVKAGKNVGKLGSGMVSITVGQQSQSLVFISEPERVRMHNIQRSGREMMARSGGDVGCERHTDDQCLAPTDINGYFVRGTTRFDGPRSPGTDFEIVKDSTSEVCVRVWALSAVCQTEVRIDGRPIVTERYPGP
jgi:hypothetical protein